MVHIFYTGLDIPTRIMLDYKGFIPLVTPTQSLKSIQVMADHSHNWYDVATTKERVKDFSDNVDTMKIKEKIHAIQQAANDEWIRKFTKNTDLNLRALDTTTKNLQKDIKDLVPRDLLVVHPYVPPTLFPGHLKEQKGNSYKTYETVCMIGIPQKIHKKKAQEDEGDMDDGWDIKVKDVERLRKILTPP
ncbi:hypothetical protein Tco_0556240 [Tanacetum coccineum]